MKYSKQFHGTIGFLVYILKADMNINHKNPNKGFSFTIRHADDTYTLLDCDLHLNDIKELNRTNGLFKFVRIMRQKLQEAAAQGFVPQSAILQQESSTVSMSVPVFSISSDRSESQANRYEQQFEHGEVDQSSKKHSSGNGCKNKSNS